MASGQVFVAFRGERFDGHEQVAAAFEAGASAVVVERTSDVIRRKNAGPLLVVDSSLAALGRLARQYRRRFDIPVVAVAGSAGKTTVKEMITAVLGRRFRVLSTPRNENNEVGVPRTILGLTPEHGAAVIEMGARRVGDIAYLCRIVQPNIGVLLNIGTAHLEVFGSVGRVAKAKGELLDFIEDESYVALVNADDCVIAGEAMRTKGRLLGFGWTREGHFSGEGLVLDQEGCGHFSLQNTSFHLRVPGRHNAHNALAAIAVADQCGLSASEAAAALADFVPLSMRSEILRKAGIRVINDCYNANPGSVRAALDLMAARRCGALRRGSRGHTVGHRTSECPYRTRRPRGGTRTQPDRTFRRSRLPDASIEVHCRRGRSGTHKGVARHGVGTRRRGVVMM
jgi:UDP-N-acetylmuramoyl-tripeptide--D-alanyl-D-alanine ligase